MSSRHGITRYYRLGVDPEVPTWVRLGSLVFAFGYTLMLGGCFWLGVSL